MGQKAIFILDYMHVTQGENGSFSHEGTLAMDLVGAYDEYPYFAPFDAKCVWRNDNEAILGWVSVEPVLCADGITRNIMFRVIHDCTLMFNVGDTVKQGDLIGRTGNCGNSSGDHVHLESYEATTYDRSIPLHNYDVFLLPEVTTIIDDGGYNWVIVDETRTPPPTIPQNNTNNTIVLFLVGALRGWN